ncbi:hypothetical protein ACFVXH_19775 [Kitasatospora sp. NPDC058184]|uniref:hypothetical protein n=1 Tax=Kitasatospora sp. NPDC058184 TaxID=3346370 RepID=UPI0036D7CE47
MTDTADTSSRTAAERLPAAYAPRVALIRGAMEAGNTALATRLAEELHRYVALERGTLHPETLRAQEVRAYVAAVGGDPLRAADLFAVAATAWAGLGASEQWAASRNAEVCRRRAESAAAAPSAVPLAVPVARRPPGCPSPVRAFGRGTVVAVVLATALLSGAADAGPRAYLGMGPRPVPDDQPVAPAVVGVLERSAPSASPVPVPVPSPSELATAEPVPAPDAGPAGDQEDQAADQGDGGPGRTPVPSPGRRPGFPAAGSRPRPAPEAGRPSGGQAADADPCAAAGAYGGQFLGSLVELCHRAAGVSGKRSPAP